MRIRFCSFLILYLLSLQVFGQGEDVSLVDTCNCPEIEEFSEDIHAVLSKIYQDENPSDVPVQFDQLTLVIDLQTRFEDNLSCQETYGELNEFEEEITKSINESSLITPFQNAIQYSGNISLQEFRPSFMRIASENDRTLFFRTIINGEEKYILMFVDRLGQTKVEILNAPPTPFAPTAESPVAIALEEQRPVPLSLANFTIDPSQAFSFDEGDSSTIVEVAGAPEIETRRQLVTEDINQETVIPENETFTSSVIPQDSSIGQMIPEDTIESIDSGNQWGYFGSTMFDGGTRTTATQNEVGYENSILTDNGNTLQFGYLISADGAAIRRPVPGDDDFEPYMAALRERNDGSDISYLDELRRNSLSRHTRPNEDRLRGVTTRANLQYSYRFGDATPTDPNFDPLSDTITDGEDIGRRLTFSADLTKRFDTGGELTSEERALGLEYRNGDLGTSFRIADEGDGTPANFALTYGNLNGDNLMADLNIRNQLDIRAPEISFSQMPYFTAGGLGTSKAPISEKGGLSFGSLDESGASTEDERYYELSANGTTVDGVEELTLRTSRQDSDTLGYVNLSYNIPRERLDLDTARGTIDGESVTQLEASIGAEGPNSLTLTAYRQGQDVEFPTGVNGDVAHITSIHLSDSEWRPSELSYDRVATTSQDSPDGLQVTQEIKQQGIIASQDRVVLRFSTATRETFSRDTSLRETEYEIANDNPNIRDMGYQEYASSTTYTAGELTITEDSVEGTIIRQIEDSDITGTTSSGFGVYAFHGLEGDAFEVFANFSQTSPSGNDSFGCRASLRAETAEELGRSPSQFTSLSAAPNSTTCQLTAVRQADGDIVGEFEFRRRYQTGSGSTDLYVAADTRGDLDLGFQLRNEW